jgi:O-antigen ligase
VSSYQGTIGLRPSGAHLRWVAGLLLAAIVAAVDTLIAYAFSPLLALALPIAAGAAIVFFYKPMVGVYAALLFVPAEALNLSFGSFGLTPTKAILLLVGGVIAIRFLVAGRQARAHPAYVAFMAGQVVSILGVLVAQDTFTVIKIWITWSAFLAISMYVSSADVRQLKTIFYCLIVGGAILAGESVAHGTNQSLLNGGLAATDRAQGSFTHPAQLAFWLLLAVSPGLIMLFVAPASVRPLLLGAVALAITGLLLTLTRGAIVGFVGSLLLLLTWVRFRRFALVLLLLAGIYTASNFTAISRSREISVVSTRLSTVAQGAQTGGDRLQIWKATPRIIADHPLLGVGAGNFSTVSLAYGLSEGGLPFAHAHDLLLTIGAERGLLALAFAVWFLVAVARTGLATLRDRTNELYPYALGLCAGLLGLLIDSLVDYPPGQDAVMGTLMISVGALIALERHMRAGREACSPGVQIAAQDARRS